MPRELQEMQNTSSVGEMLGELEWPSLEARRDRSSLLLFYKTQPRTLSIPAKSFLQSVIHRNVRKVGTGGGVFTATKEDLITEAQLTTDHRLRNCKV